MDKYESLIAAVVFQYTGIYAYNRQQLCEFTAKDLDEEFVLRVGEIIRRDGVDYKITNIHFAMESQWFSNQKQIPVFSQSESNPVNCKICVFLDEA
ncbi:hypothetical protein KIH23_13420 [Flavobacterium sp. CYK-55]|uniref:hypothetical protein n=1 Tax=Flavobacterium sp. CYK-55 TaxID=2835529 RepID=UPI001BCEF2AB|nr:hypothetical protein [Flavobacterium sp. CYK-55]MBS7788302.1 hypothetical protein [Flavobacterium sp. CYK-55]